MGINNKYAYATVDTSILNTTKIHSQNLSSVSKITKNNNNNNNNIIFQPKCQHFIKYIQLEPEPPSLPSKSHFDHWIYTVIKLILLFLFVQQNTVRNFIDIVINQHSDTLSYINNKTVLKIIRDHHTYLLSPYQNPQHSQHYFLLHLQYINSIREFRFCKCGTVLG